MKPTIWRAAARLANDRDDMQIAATIIAMAQGLGLKVLAEGMETVMQLEFLA